MELQRQEKDKGSMPRLPELHTYWIIRHLAFILPASLVMLAFVAYPYYLPSDWLYHITFPHRQSWILDYPQTSSFITSLFWKSGLIGVWCVMLFIVIPYLLLWKITKREDVPLAYLYLSGIPWVLCWGGFFSQAMEHVLLLLNFISPWFWLPTLIAGFFTHRESLGAWAFSIPFAAWLMWSRFASNVRVPYGFKP